MALGKYIATLKNALLQQLEYRFDTFLRFLLSLISLVSVFYLWNDVFGSRAVLAGYTKEQIVTYYIIVGYLFGALFTAVPIAQEIQDGTLSNYLTKPAKYLWIKYCEDLARKIFRLVLALPVLILIFAIWRDHLYFVSSVKNYIFLFATCLGAINILFLLEVLTNSIEFWMYHSDSVTNITDVIVSFFAGTLIPIAFLPIYIQKVANFLPFKYTGLFLIDSFLGRLAGWQVAIGMCVQIFWTLVLLVVVRFVWKRGLKRYEAFGG